MDNVRNLNEIIVSGTLKSIERKETQTGKVFYEGVIVNRYFSTKGPSVPKTFEFTVVAFGENGKKLLDIGINGLCVLKGRLENYAGVSKDGRHFTGYYKIVASEVNYVETKENKEKPSFSGKNDTNVLIAIDDVPF